MSAATMGAAMVANVEAIPGTPTIQDTRFYPAISQAILDNLPFTNYPVAVVSGAYQILPTDYFVFVSGGPYTVNLPLASATTGRVLEIMKTDTPFATSLAISIAANAGSPGDFTTTTVNTFRDKIRLYSNGVVWTQLDRSFYQGRTAYTPSSLAWDGWGTVTALTVLWNRVGNRIQCTGRCNIGTVGAAVGTYRLPDGLTVDNTQMPTGRVIVGNPGNNGAFQQPQCVYWDPVNLRISFGIGRSSAPAVGELDDVLVNSFYGSGTNISFNFELPITGWGA